MIAAPDRVFVPAAFADRLAHMPTRTTETPVRVAWLCAQLAELTDPAVIATADGLAALRLATHVQRELSVLPGSAVNGAG
ncbi:MAG: hypothetical protein GEV28_34540 [Actinophytocola sp.]|uniref:hypothetical protein n=1 Tax=Actinophytocola sp. TaxID=1872138 RepID=UPI001323BDC5|nr:hypothetical protein [Actinophytocola sp.]MPZ85234.1 hypothetical protein [Actinophytocola sp.]